MLGTRHLKTRSGIIIVRHRSMVAYHYDIENIMVLGEFFVACCSDGLISSGGISCLI